MSKKPKRTAQEEVLERVMERAQGDQVFRAELLAEPKRVIERELGIELPADAVVRVIEEEPNALHLILPAEASEVSDEDLDKVTGGLSSLRLARGTLRRFPTVQLSST